jgi:hypothetical protein
VTLAAFCSRFWVGSWVSACVVGLEDGCELRQRNCVVVAAETWD